jgi:hypothetical protein
VRAIGGSKFLDRPLLEVMDAIEDASGRTRAEFLRKYPNDLSSQSFATELTTRRRKEFDDLLSSTRQIIETRIETARQKLDEFRTRFEGPLDDVVRTGADIPTLEPHKVADAVLGPADERYLVDAVRRLLAAAPARPSLRPLAMRISFATGSYDPAVVLLGPGPCIEAWLLGGRGADLGKGSLGVVETSAGNDAAWIIRNSSNLSWRVTTTSGTSELASGHTQHLVPGDMIDFGGGVTGHVEAT